MEPTEKKTVEISGLNILTPVSEASVEDIAQTAPGYAAVNETASYESADNNELQNIIECMLFVSNDPMIPKQLAEMLELDEDKVQSALDMLQKKFDNSHGLQIVRVAGGYQICTRPEYADYCAIILQPAKKRLSKAALETLAVVAYRQPCTMPEVEAVRGVSVDGVMKTLIDRGMVREAGRRQTPGKPIIYATTQEFLEHFGLNDISELPDIDMLAVEEVKALEAQKELFVDEQNECSKN